MDRPTNDTRGVRFLKSLNFSKILPITTDSLRRYIPYEACFEYYFYTDPLIVRANKDAVESKDVESSE